MEPREPVVPRTGAAAPTTDDDPGGSGLAVLIRTPEGLRTVYQPIVDLRSGDVVGYEALTRVAEWPARSPEPWFAAADRQGLGGDIEAAATASSLRARPLLRPGQFLLVNISAAAVLHPAVTAVLLAERDLDGVVVGLGGVAAADPGRLAAALAGLRAHGLLVAAPVDDGGCTELRRLAQVRPDLVELGAGLVRGIAGDGVAQRVAGLVRQTADDLGAVVLAGGVEALEDARWLQRSGTPMGQGWLFGRARAGLLQPSPEIVAWLRAGPDDASPAVR